METTHQQQDDLTAERTAAYWNQTDGVRRYGPAFAVFAAAVGHLVAIRDPELFDRSYVGTWASEDNLISDFIEESGLEASLDALPTSIRAVAGIDRTRVAHHLRDQLLVLPTDDQVWVFDVPRHVVKTTVQKSEQKAHTNE